MIASTWAPSALVTFSAWVVSVSPTELKRASIPVFNSSCPVVKVSANSRVRSISVSLIWRPRLSSASSIVLTRSPISPDISSDFALKLSAAESKRPCRSSERVPARVAKLSLTLEKRVSIAPETSSRRVSNAPSISLRRLVNTSSISPTRSLNIVARL